MGGGDARAAALLAAGEDLGLVLVGAKAYSSANLESGWVPSPLPAIFTGDARSGVPGVAAGRTKAGSLGGSFDSDDIEDYYLTPYDLGYGKRSVRPRLHRPRGARAAWPLSRSARR